MDPNIEVTIHLPFFVVPQKCAETCKHLRAVKNSATLRSVQEPDSQMVVICNRNRRFLCEAQVYDAGMWMYDGDGSGNKTYYGNPAIIENGYGYGSVSRRIRTAKTKGDAQEYTDLPAI